MPDPLVLSVDLDGVLVNFRAGFVAVAKDLCGVTIPVQAPSWHWFRAYLSPEQEQAVFARIGADAAFWGRLQ